MNKRCVSCLMVVVCWLSVAYSEPNYEDSAASVNSANAEGHQSNSLFNTNTDNNMDGDTVDGMLLDANVYGKDNYDKRVERYAFGLGRRAYTYTNGGNGIKRLPVYNFGLGKRARPYSFGLGKRSNYEDEDGQMADRAFNAAFLLMDEKRNRPYSFGLGKRDAAMTEDRRANRYGFGLGRR